MQRPGMRVTDPVAIEETSLQIIGQELERRGLWQDADPLQRDVVKRVIHTTADFDFAHTLAFTPRSVAVGVAAMKLGATVVTDTQMAAAGINTRVLESFGGRLLNFTADPDVAKEAKARRTTRSAVAMERACDVEGPLVFALGNAPTAVLSVCDLVVAGRLKPTLVIGVPVGFVNVVESKDSLLALPVSSIVARGNKGGSPVAAAIVNALLYEANGGRH